MSITHTQPSSSPPITTTGWDAAHTVTTITMPEGSAPSTPSSGNAVIYVKTDGRFYSKGSDGVEHGPFDSASAAFDADGTTDLYGLDSLAGSANILDDKFNYASWSAFTAVWTPRNLATDKILVLPGHGLLCTEGASSGTGIEYVLGTGNCDVILGLQAMRLVNSGDMLGIHQVDSSTGNGSGFTENYDGNSYSWTVSGRAYGGTGTNYGAAPANKRSDGRRFCLGWKRNGTTNTFYTRNASTGSWTTIGSDTRTAQNRLFLGSIYAPNGASPLFFSRVMIGSLGNLL